MPHILLALVLGLALAGLTWGITRRKEALLPNSLSSGIHKDGLISKFPDVEFPKKYLLCKIGSDANHITLCGATDIPWGVVNDSTDIAGVPDLGVPLNVNVLGGSGWTARVQINSTVTQGDLLVPDANGYAKTRVAGTSPQYVIGKAMDSGAAGDFIEFAPLLPTPHAGFSVIASGTGVVGVTSTTTDNIPVAGLLTTDVPIVTLNTQASTETIKTTQSAAGQINIVLSAAATANTTKYNYVVYRPVNA